MFGLGKKTAAQPAFEPWDVLIGLAPALVEDLAQLVGQTEEDLLVTFQVMPYGDRATLAAYSMIEMDRSPEGRRRVTSVSPAAIELVNMASEFLSEVDNFDVGNDAAPRPAVRAHLLASAAVPWVHVVANAADQEGVPVHGVVVEVDGDKVRVAVPLRSEQGVQNEASALEERFQIVPEHEIGREGTRVVLSYESADAPLDTPRAVAVEEYEDDEHEVDELADA